jgi:hypothetical protein
MGWLPALICGGLLLAGPMMAQAQGGRRADAAGEIYRLTNQDRMRHGLAPLGWDGGLERSAEAHMEWMLRARELQHQYPGEAPLVERARQAGVAYSEVAENLAAGFSPESVEVGWMHSPEHRRNILDPGLTAVGIAAVWHYGRLYVVEDFAHVIAARGPEQVERRVGELLRQQGIDPDGPRAPAEAACRSQQGTPGGPGVRLVIRFETSDLHELPGQVLDVLHRGHYTRAGVGACAPERAQPGFTTFRVALVLY